MHRNKSGADIVFRQKKQASIDAFNPASALVSQEDATNAEKPDIPVWLATARARDALVTESSTPTTIPQQSPQTPFSPYHNSHYGQQQHQIGTPAVPQPAPSAPSPLSYQSQYGQFTPMPMIADSTSRGPHSPYAPQYAGANPHVMPVNTRQQLLSTSVRPTSWHPEGRSPSGQSASPAPTNFPQQSPHMAQPFQYNPNQQQPPGQPMQEQSPSSTSAAFSQQPPPSMHSTSYPNSLPERSPLDHHHHHSPPDGQALVGSHLPPTNYWPPQPPPSTTPFEIPEITAAPNHHSSTGRPPSLPLVYDQSQAGPTEASSATPPQLPFPVAGQARSLLANVTPGYYVRAAGTLQKYPADLVHP